GLRLRGQKADLRKIFLYLTLIVGFIVGGIAGSILFVKYQFTAILVPCVVTAAIAISYWFFQHYQYRSKSGSQ
ncbi:MAG: hypothetical protein K2P84_02325, partial [Undibacterium sp.]|nr:hypothetical protein [Undibacterium sp.]